MCGVNGFVGQNAPGVDVLERMNDATAHRGPDGKGTFVDAEFFIGHNLLSIADIPNRSQQPFVSENGRYALAYNGEIYNYRELREELKKAGMQFTTDSDTEVIFKGLIRHGVSYLEKLDGMFGLAFYDKEKELIFLARDRSGMKPLYYTTHHGVFVFSSEIRGLLAYGLSPILDIDSAKLFFLFGYVPTSATLFKGIRKVEPGTVLSIDEHGNVSDIRRFDSPSKSIGNELRNPAALREKLHQAVLSHTMGLRPFGLFLSGGLDSTIILHELTQNLGAPVETYTTRFATRDPRYNEDADLAARLSTTYRINHHELLVTERAFLDHYEDALLAMEEPRYNHSVPAYWLLAQEAAKKITVVLNGSGGDELFLGYPRYLTAQNITRKYAHYPAVLLDLFYSLQAVRSGLIAPGRMLHLGRVLDQWAYISKITPPGSQGFRFMNRFDMSEAVRILAETYLPPVAQLPNDTTNAVASLDRYYWLANEEFLRTDKIIMHFGMEGRFPFLARDVTGYADALSSEDKLAHGTKTLLRDAYRGMLPDYILSKKKTGWNAPVAEWMTGEFGDMARSVLSTDFYAETNSLFDFEIIRKRELNKDSYTLADLKKFLPLVQFQIWARAFNIRLP